MFQSETIMKAIIGQIVSVLLLSVSIFATNSTESQQDTFSIAIGNPEKVHSEGKDIYIVFNGTDSTEIYDDDLSVENYNVTESIVTNLESVETKLEKVVNLEVTTEKSLPMQEKQHPHHNKIKIKPPKKKKKHKKGGHGHGHGHGLMKMMMHPYMLIPQLIMLGFSPIILANLKMFVMNALMINNMALSSAIFMTLRNMVFGPAPGPKVKYHNFGYKKPTAIRHYVPPDHSSDYPPHIHDHPSPHILDHSSHEMKDHPPSEILDDHPPMETNEHQSPHKTYEHPPHETHAHDHSSYEFHDHRPPKHASKHSTLYHREMFDKPSKNNIEPHIDVHALTHETYQTPYELNSFNDDFKNAPPTDSYSSLGNNYSPAPHEHQNYNVKESGSYEDAVNVEVVPSQNIYQSSSFYVPSGESDHHAIVDSGHYSNKNFYESDDGQDEFIDRIDSEVQSSGDIKSKSTDSSKRISSVYRAQSIKQNHRLFRR